MEKMIERVPDILARLAVVERKMEGLDALWKSTADDIKSTIRAEISDLKSEQIADMRERINARQLALEEVEKRLRNVEGQQRDWDTGRSIVDWLIRLIIGSGAAVAGYWGGKHL